MLFSSLLLCLNERQLNSLFVAFCRCCFNGRDVYSLYPLFSCQNCVFALGVSVGMMVRNLSDEIMEQGLPASLYTSK